MKSIRFFCRTAWISAVTHACPLFLSFRKENTSNRDLLHSTRNHTQYSVIMYKGWESGKEYIYKYIYTYIYIWINEFLCCMLLLAFSNGSVSKESACNAKDTGVWSLGQENPLEEEMTTHSSVPVCKTPWTEESSGPHFMESQRVGHV